MDISGGVGTACGHVRIVPHMFNSLYQIRKKEMNEIYTLCITMMEKSRKILEKEEISETDLQVISQTIDLMKFIVNSN